MVTKTSFVTSSPHHVSLITFLIASFPKPRAHLQPDSGPLFRSTNQHRQIQLATYCLIKGFKKRPSITFSS
jgi:hypothetical protein